DSSETGCFSQYFRIGSFSNSEFISHAPIVSAHIQEKQKIALLQFQRQLNVFGQYVIFHTNSPKDVVAPWTQWSQMRSSLLCPQNATRIKCPYRKVVHAGIHYYIGLGCRAPNIEDA